MLTILILWILFGIISAVVASSKGRSGCGWFIIGVLIGPFGLILALVTPKKTVEIEREAINSGAMKKCPYCAELIKAEAIKCRYCGEDLKSGGEIAFAERQIPQKGIKPPPDGRQYQTKRILLFLAAIIALMIIAANLGRKKEEPESPTKKSDVVLYTLVCPQNGINIRTGPGTNYAKDELGPLSKGDTLYVLSYNNEWLKFRLTPNDEKWSGWVLKRLVVKAEPKARQEYKSKPQEKKESKSPLKFDVIKTSGLGNTMVEVKVKITNNTDRHIRNARVTCILKDSNRREIAFQDHYAIRSMDGGLAPHRSTYFTYIVDANYSQVHYISFQIETLNFR